MTRIYLSLLFLMYMSIAFSQADAGVDKTVSGGRSTKIGIVGDRTKCYHWVATPSDPSLTDASSGQLKVNPSQTTVYKLTVIGFDFSSLVRDEVTVFKFGIEYFRHSVGKEWKVVVGEPIEFNATASSDCKNWDWDMEDGFPDMWNPVGGNKKSGTNILISSSDLPSNNDSFGDAYGTLNVSCEDADGATHEISSIDINPATKVKVFYQKNGKKSITDLPNWFVYWSQFIPKGRIAKLTFGNIKEYGVTNPETRETIVSQIASEHNNETNDNGLHTFYQTIAHENHHIVLWEGWWPSGYDWVGFTDDSDKDTYPDHWELSNPEAISYGFIVGQNDHYRISNSSGYKYEEDKCRAVERSLTANAYDNKDWSYDPTGINQGKQW